MKKQTSANSSQSVLRDGKEVAAASEFQHLREFVQNSIEANAEDVHITYEPEAWDKYRVARTVFLDNGDGFLLPKYDSKGHLTRQDKFYKMLNESDSGKSTVGDHNNFGIGAKITSRAFNKFGLVVISWNSEFPDGLMMIIRHVDEDGGHFYAIDADHLPSQSAPDYYCDSEVYTPCYSTSLMVDFAETVKKLKAKYPKMKKQGTAIILCGSHPFDSTAFKGANGKVHTQGDFVTYLNTRFFEFKKSVSINHTLPTYPSPQKKDNVAKGQLSEEELSEEEVSEGVSEAEVPEEEVSEVVSEAEVPEEVSEVEGVEVSEGATEDPEGKKASFHSQHKALQEALGEAYGRLISELDNMEVPEDEVSALESEMEKFYKDFYTNTSLPQVKSQDTIPRTLKKKDKGSLEGMATVSRDSFRAIRKHRGAKENEKTEVIKGFKTLLETTKNALYYKTDKDLDTNNEFHGVFKVQGYTFYWYILNGKYTTINLAPGIKYSGLGSHELHSHARTGVSLLYQGEIFNSKKDLSDYGIPNWEMKHPLGIGDKLNERVRLFVKYPEAPEGGHMDGVRPNKYRTELIFVRANGAGQEARERFNWRVSADLFTKNMPTQIRNLIDEYQPSLDGGDVSDLVAQATSWFGGAKGATSTTSSGVACTTCGNPHRCTCACSVCRNPKGSCKCLDKRTPTPTNTGKPRQKKFKGCSLTDVKIDWTEWVPSNRKDRFPTFAVESVGSSPSSILVSVYKNSRLMDRLYSEYLPFYKKEDEVASQVLETALKGVLVKRLKSAVVFAVIDRDSHPNESANHEEDAKTYLSPQSLQHCFYPNEDFRKEMETLLKSASGEGAREAYKALVRSKKARKKADAQSEASEV